MTERVFEDAEVSAHGWHVDKVVIHKNGSLIVELLPSRDAKNETSGKPLTEFERGLQRYRITTPPDSRVDPAWMLRRHSAYARF